MFNIKNYPIVYRGSVKNLRAIRQPRGGKTGVYLFEFTDRYSIFDYGVMPDNLRGKGQAMALMSANIYERLEDPESWKALRKARVRTGTDDKEFKSALFGSKEFKFLTKFGLRTHYRGMIDRNGRRVRSHDLLEPTNIIEVESANILHPKIYTTEGRSLWDYNMFHTALVNYLIPLEVVFRFGLPEGSSLLKRLEHSTQYQEELGLKGKPRSGEWLKRPLIEYFSKLEPHDRHLPMEVALNFSGLSGEEFLRMKRYTLLISLFLKNLFLDAGSTLWDGKLEFIKSKAIILSDAITPDELRLTIGNVQISKETIRQYYRNHDRDFCKKIEEAKEIVKISGKKIRTVMNKLIGCRPKRMDPRFRRAVEEMYILLATSVTAIDVFPKGRSLNEVTKIIEEYIN